ncbi:MAG: acyltransferase family protein [Actinoplanes sp.]
MTGRTERLDWADVAKGACILLVVLWHVIMKHYLQISWHLPVPLPGAWGALGEQFLPLRMPVFFAISGMFAASAVQRPWRVVARSRVARFYYLYLLWFALHTAVLSLVPGFDTLAAHSVLDVVEQVTITPTNLWYLIALAGYFVIAKVSRSLPAPVVLAAAFLLSAVASAGLPAAPGNRGQLYQNLLFFLVGLRGKDLLVRWAGAATPRRLLVGGVAYLGLTAAVEVAGLRQWFGVWPLLSLLAIAVGIAAAVQVQRWDRTGRLLARLGRNTLPIYVMHMPLLALLHLMLLGPFSALGTGPQLVLAVLLPVALTALLVVACLQLHRVLQTIGARWLFDLPGVRGGRDVGTAVTQ